MAINNDFIIFPEILEGLTSLANTLSFQTKSHENFKENAHIINGNQHSKKEVISFTKLNGITLQNASFEPQFPDIESEINKSNIFNYINKNDSSPIFEANHLKSFKNICEDSESLVDKTIWQNFTAILNSKTPKSSKNLNFTNNFKINLTQNKNDFGEMSDTPFSLASTDSSFPDNKSQPIQEGISYGSIGSISPSSIEFSTPQRLYDLCIVRKRLAELSSTSKAKN